MYFNVHYAVISVTAVKTINCNISYFIVVIFSGMTYNEKVDVFSFGIVMCEVGWLFVTQ